MKQGFWLSVVQCCEKAILIAVLSAGCFFALYYFCRGLAELALWLVD